MGMGWGWVHRHRKVIQGGACDWIRLFSAINLLAYVLIFE